MTSIAPPLPPCPARFAARKAAILAQLARPDDEYADASPKGAVDAGIRPLLDVINGLDGFVTTSSCAGRVAVFLEGRRGGGGGGGGTTDGETVEHVVRDDDGNGAPTTVAAVSAAAAVAPPTRASSSGGKGGGGTWLFVSHDPLVSETDGRGGSSSSTADRYRSTDWASVFGLSMAEADGVDDDAGVDSQEERLVHFKFEPMILHVLTASLAHAQLLLRCAAAAGFRESGAVGIAPGTAAGAGPDSRADGPAPTPIVAVRSMGLGLASVVGVADTSSGGNDDDQTTAKARCIVSRGYLARLARLADQRFATNRARTERFRAALVAAVGRGQGGPADDSTAAAAAATTPNTWEDADARRARKRAEGLRRQAALKEASAAATGERQEGEALL
ncbi:cog1590 daomin protein [Niveomyces insectorum RCEF 264]|uniref:tRNA(Phe) 7-[(3-amino-3-carboxypropyl)-4-demethylwyosine(37)-N(4)]-methyltransferase n=1 Tax=Niveomyces insectorum RCEF 264 TaxID=1081102 RepID=A0A167TFN5_9HYPO|nr:cog1590 daomin protein [Niveomyces insectorum RCEF 264]